MTLCWGRAHEKKLYLIFRSLYYLNHENSMPQSLEIKNRAQHMRYGRVVGGIEDGVDRGTGIHKRALGSEQHPFHHTMGIWNPNALFIPDKKGNMLCPHAFVLMAMIHRTCDPAGSWRYYVQPFPVRHPPRPLTVHHRPGAAPAPGLSPTHYNEKKERMKK